MWLQILIITLAAFAVEAIKVPVETTDENVTKTAPAIAEEVIPIYYVSDEANIDSFLIPPDPHKPEEVDVQKVPTPVTYLLPPAPDSKNEYYVKSTEPVEQTDWYPIVAEPQTQTETIPILREGDQPKLQAIENLRIGKGLDRGHVISVPSRSLLPPPENAPNDFVVISPSVELELPAEEIDHTLNISPTNIHVPILRDQLQYPRKFPIQPNSIPVPYITPPIAQEYKNPTLLYPKKYQNQFIPIPIPVSQFADSVEEVPVANPAAPFKPATNTDNEYLISHDQKKNFLYEQAEQKRKVKQKHKDVTSDTTLNDPPSEVLPAEQEASETNYRSPGHDYSGAIKTTQNVGPSEKFGIKSKGERTEFRMHGMKGPHSYQFGYDTGKGKNRQFRYEERDNDGHVKGHYGYVDKFGKLRVVNYDADPEHGFRAEVPEEKE